MSALGQAFAFFFFRLLHYLLSVLGGSQAYCQIQFCPGISSALLIFHYGDLKALELIILVAWEVSFVICYSLVCLQEHSQGGCLCWGACLCVCLRPQWPSLRVVPGLPFTALSLRMNFIIFLMSHISVADSIKPQYWSAWRNHHRLYSEIEASSPYPIELKGP